MSLLSIVLALVIVGLILWVVNTYIPMDSKIKTILNVVIVVIVVLWLLRSFGLIGSYGRLNL